jgi:DTW domain-containing protein YfiP
VCAGHRDIRTPLAVDVLMHHREQYRPSSTGNLIGRVMPETRLHLWRRERRMTAAEVKRPERELWVLHPNGDPAPTAGVRPEEVQILLLDGSWSEASAMAQEIATWGRRVSLPMTGESRYWLRAQQDGGRFSTIEALLFLLRHFGLDEAHAALAVQFELHVYASLRSRGRLDVAEEFLRDSPVPKVLPDVLSALHVKRPRD